MNEQERLNNCVSGPAWDPLEQADPLDPRAPEQELTFQRGALFHHVASHFPPGPWRNSLMDLVRQTTNRYETLAAMLFAMRLSRTCPMPDQLAQAERILQREVDLAALARITEDAT